MSDKNNDGGGGWTTTHGVSRGWSRSVTVGESGGTGPGGTTSSTRSISVTVSGGAEADPKEMKQRLDELCEPLRDENDDPE